MSYTNEVRKFDDQRFEFVLYINDNIICQRYFNIKEYNEASLNSVELKELMDSIVGMNHPLGKLGIIPDYLQKKSIKVLWESYNPYAPSQEEFNKNIFEKIDNFQFEIKVDKKSVAKAQFSGNYFQPRVRYAVDIKEIIPEITSEIKDYLSLKKYNKVSV